MFVLILVWEYYESVVLFLSAIKNIIK